MSESVTPWLEEPLADFVARARVRLALVVEPSGRVLAQHGFTRSLDVMSTCSLVAAIHASSSELGRMLDGAPFGPLHYAGAARQLFLGPMPATGRTLLLLAVFDEHTTFGVVRHFFHALAAVAGAQDAPTARPEVLPADFELELGRNLAVLFGRA